MSAMAHSDPDLLCESPLRAANLPDAEALVREAGWNQVAADWRIFLEIGAVYAVRNSAARVIATAATIPYGGRVAWISMVLVAGDYRGRGIATGLLRRCVDDCVARRLQPVLDATPAGRKVYLRLGFEDSWGFTRYSAPGALWEDVAPQTPDGVVIRRISDDEWLMLSRYDAQTFGADRSALLARLRGRAPEAELVAWRADRMIGFVLGRDGRSAAQLGPVAAEDEGVAQALLARALAHVRGPIYIDLADDKSALRRWLEGRGFAPQRPFTRMGFRRAVTVGDLARTMAVAGPELG
ncbi:MAG: GNAT family N-acetyltransferase [Hyphomicrobiales bacterium]|nr:GNAT family N-acetyltransferase [Hyphomicrobiales bacterium]